MRLAFSHSNRCPVQGWSVALLVFLRKKRCFLPRLALSLDRFGSGPFCTHHPNFSSLSGFRIGVWFFVSRDYFRVDFPC